ncbi:hypothetical protein [Streptomyces sp. PTD5-9]|uniref:hypothetical protein n=1 Tax=Streptomyces sp. PTD5-9 TaxID=3120150 RepID=UPI003008AFE6
MRVRMIRNVGTGHRAGRSYDIPDEAARGYIDRGLAEPEPNDSGTAPTPPPPAAAGPEPAPAAQPAPPARAPRGRRSKTVAKDTPQKET